MRRKNKVQVGTVFLKCQQRFFPKFIVISPVWNHRYSVGEIFSFKPETEKLKLLVKKIISNVMMQVSWKIVFIALSIVIFGIFFKLDFLTSLKLSCHLPFTHAFTALTYRRRYYLTNKNQDKLFQNETQCGKWVKFTKSQNMDDVINGWAFSNKVFSQQLILCGIQTNLSDFALTCFVAWVKSYIVFKGDIMILFRSGNRLTGLENHPVEDFSESLVAFRWSC